MGKHRIQNMKKFWGLDVWLFPVPGAVDTMRGLGREGSLLGFCSPLAMPFASTSLCFLARVTEGPSTSTDRPRMCLLLDRHLPGLHHKVPWTRRWSDVQWESLSSPWDSRLLRADLTSTEVLWIIPSVWVECCTLPLHSCL